MNLKYTKQYPRVNVYEGRWPATDMFEERIRNLQNQNQSVPKSPVPSDNEGESVTHNTRGNRTRKLNSKGKAKVKPASVN
jgi:hypothetical protein